MKVLVLYYSKTGNTKRLAQEIAKGVEEVSGVEAILRSTQEVTEEDFLTCQGLIAGSPVYFGSMAAELKAVFDRFVYLRKKMENKIGAAFATSADPSGGKETTMISILQVLLIYGMIVVGDPMDATGHYGVACSGSPDERTLSNARKLGRRVAELVKRLSS
ncbi:MAG: flavodoxin family protein [Deltaproteobacteria bacterium]|nr:MAG: flavodoxin family protein [Deltaproteobacteria bacterium]